GIDDLDVDSVAPQDRGDVEHPERLEPVGGLPARKERRIAERDLHAAWCGRRPDTSEIGSTGEESTHILPQQGGHGEAAAPPRGRARKPLKDGPPPVSGPAFSGSSRRRSAASTRTTRRPARTGRGTRSCWSHR